MSFDAWWPVWALTIRWCRRWECQPSWLMPVDCLTIAPLFRHDYALKFIEMISRAAYFHRHVATFDYIILLYDEFRKPIPALLKRLLRCRVRRAATSARQQIQVREFGRILSAWSKEGRERLMTINYAAMTELPRELPSMAWWWFMVCYYASIPQILMHYHGVTIRRRFAIKECRRAGNIFPRRWTRHYYVRPSPGKCGENCFPPSSVSIDNKRRYFGHTLNKFLPRHYQGRMPSKTHCMRASGKATWGADAMPILAGMPASPFLQKCPAPRYYAQLFILGARGRRRG